MQFQQGDVWIESIPSIPVDAKPDNRQGVLAEGEGHHIHRAAVNSDVEFYKKDGVTYARFRKETIVEHVTPDGRHGEHHPLRVPAGDYQFGQVQEYDYLAEMARPVVD